VILSNPTGERDRGEEREKRGGQDSRVDGDERRFSLLACAHLSE